MYFVRFAKTMYNSECRAFHSPFEKEADALPPFQLLPAELIGINHQIQDADLTPKVPRKKLQSHSKIGSGSV